METTIHEPALKPETNSGAKSRGNAAPAPEPYASSIAHVLAELERIDLLIQIQIGRARQLQQQDEFQGLYISEQEVDSLLARPMGMPHWALAPSVATDENIHASLMELEAQIEGRTNSSIEQNIPLRLVALAKRFHLSPFDVDVVLMCLATELDVRYERLYAYLQDDVTRKRPSVDLALNLLCPSFSAKLAARDRFNPPSPLLNCQLVSLSEDTAFPKTSLLNRSLKLDDRIVNYLLGGDEIDARLARQISLLEPRLSLGELILPGDLLTSLKALFENHCNADRGLNLYFQGPYGVGKRSTATALCESAGLKLLVMNVEHAPSAESDFASMLQLVTREAALQGAAVYWHGFDSLLPPEQRGRLTLLLQELQERKSVVFLAGETVWEPSDIPELPPFVRIEFPLPAYSERLLFWNTAIEKIAQHQNENLDPAGLANKFRFSGGQIRDAALTAQNLARRRDPQTASVNMTDLLEACRLQSNRKLAALATRIKPHYVWSDIILPPDTIRQLREVCNAVEFRSIVYDEWGFDRKLSLGKGLGLLFAGPSGTGKTMAAEVIAGELGLDLYKIDLSSVISKYIGETEKNLSRIFTEAATSNAVLFFDEADALFGKRSEVRDSHDRYANIEINYLLQRMEEHEGTVILATNLRKNMDDAFVRRIQFTIEFPFPHVDQRLAIWQRVWPKNMPQQDLDLNFMARRFEISGGNIRNIALSAAFLAAEDGGCVRMKHLIRATWQEYQKMGKVVMEGEFGEYEHLSHQLL
ncbi:MAG: AAA family ATPase [Candidatus Sulfotelmatobacter sp.]|jgi:SpoVK/Ycf46/Vps4 family AAA+-type ATPase